MSNTISVAGRSIGPTHPVYVVAELSANHRQRLEHALQLVDAAKAAGADAVKVQTYTADTLTLDSDRECFRIAGGTLWDGRTLYELYREASMPWEWQSELRARSTALEMDFFSSAFDPTAVDFLEELKVPVHKIASPELVDLPLIEYAARTRKPVLLSTGMASLAEIDAAVRTARRAGAAGIALLKCTSDYPADPAEMNLRTIPDLMERFGVPVGLSDHTLGCAVSVAAVALGACIVEKHLTLSRREPGPDSAFSIEPHEFADMVASIRAVEQALGKTHYGPAPHERKSVAFRRSLFVVEDLRAGEPLTDRNIRSIRPAAGLPPADLPRVLGRCAACDIERGTPLAWNLISPLPDSTREMTALAVFGGEPVRRKPFPAYNTIGQEEKRAVLDVLDSGVLSRFLGCWNPDFFGGPKVQEFEAAWCAAFGVRNAITVNSATSGLIAAVGAAGIGPGDEVIVSPYTMSASASCALVYNAVPVFADVDPSTYCLDPSSVRQRITCRTKAIVIVHLFGGPADMDPIMALAREHGLTVIEDAAQAPMARYRGRLVGTIGHIGVFSLNYHKHIHTGEGGVVVTNDDVLADRLRLIRNHAEAVVEDKGVADLVNMIGFNFRLGELEAAIGIEQLKKLPALLKPRIENAEYLAEHIGKLPGLIPPAVEHNSVHVYYTQPFRFDERQVGVNRNTFIDAVRAELPPSEMREKDGPLLTCGYIRPLYLQPMYRRRQVYSIPGFPFDPPYSDGTVRYEPGLCPVAERLHEHELFEHELMRPPATRADLDDVVRAFEKVYEHRGELRCGR